MTFNQSLRTLRNQLSRAIRRPKQATSGPLSPSRIGWSDLPFEIRSQILRHLFELLLENLVDDEVLAIGNLQNHAPFLYNYILHRLNVIHHLLIVAPELVEDAKNIATMLSNNQNVRPIPQVVFHHRTDIVIKAVSRLDDNDLKSL